MKKLSKRFVMIIGAMLMTMIMALPTFADDARTEAQYELENVDIHDYEFIDPEVGITYTQEPLSKWLSSKLSDGTDVVFMADGSKTEVEGFAFPNLYLSQKVKRDEVLSLQILNDSVAGFKIYDVKDGEFGITEYTGTLPASQSYLMHINSHTEEMQWYDDIQDEMPIEHNGHIYNSKEAVINRYNGRWAYIIFEYGLEEQEVIDAITALPEASAVALADEEAITAARAAYDALEKWKTTAPADPEIQDKVTNYSKLVECEAALAKLKEAPPTVVKKKQPMTVKAAQKKISAASLKKAKKVLKAITVKNNKGTVTYKRVSGSKKLTISSKTGKITVKKGTKKGTYKIKVKVSAKGNNTYKAGSKTVTVKIIVR